jgi:hypothetical protein
VNDDGELGVSLRFKQREVWAWGIIRSSSLKYPDFLIKPDNLVQELWWTIGFTTSYQQVRGGNMIRLGGRIYAL